MYQPAPSRGRVPVADYYAAGSLGVGLLVARVGAAAALLGAVVFARGDESSAALAVVACERSGIAAAELAFDADVVTAFIRSPRACFRVAAERTAICGAPAAACATAGLAGTTFAGVAAEVVDSFASTAAGSLAEVDFFAAGWLPHPPPRQAPANTNDTGNDCFMMTPLPSEVCVRRSLVSAAAA